MMMIPKRSGFDIFDEFSYDPFFSKKENKIMKTDVAEKDGNYVLNDRDNSLLDDIKNINFVYSKDNSSEDSDIVINSLITYTAPDNWSLNINKDLKTAVVNYNYSGAYFAFNVRILYSIDSEEVQALINKVESIVNL